MELRKLGLTGLAIPVVGLGTWRTFDVMGRDSQTARRQLVTSSLDAGVCLFDTSPMYGESERVLGAALTGRRDRAIVATKVWTPDAREGQNQIDRALYYFEDRVDIYQVHNLTNWQVYLPVFQRMKSSGTIAASGITHFQQRAFPEMIEIMRSRLVDCIQIPYDPLRPEAQQQILPLARELDLGVIVMQPFHEGLFLEECPPRSALRPFHRFGVTTWPQIVLKWILSDLRVTTVIPATRKQQHLLENAQVGQPPWFSADERREVQRLARMYYRSI